MPASSSGVSDYGAGGDRSSLEELEEILKNWNIEDGDQVLSVTSSRPGLPKVIEGLEDDAGPQGGIDVAGWANELLGHLKHCQDDVGAHEVVCQMLKVGGYDVVHEVSC